MVQWLRLHASNAGRVGLIPGQGTCHTIQKKKKEMLAIIKEGNRNELKGDLHILFFNV